MIFNPRAQTDLEFEARQGGAIGTMRQGRHLNRCRDGEGAGPLEAKPPSDTRGSIPVFQYSMRGLGSGIGPFVAGMTGDCVSLWRGLIICAGVGFTTIIPATAPPDVTRPTWHAHGRPKVASRAENSAKRHPADDVGYLIARQFAVRAVPMPQPDDCADQAEGHDCDIELLVELAFVFELL